MMSFELTIAHERVERVIREMHAKLEAPLTLCCMARIAFASRFHFHRTFRRITGLPPNQFLCALRIARARHLLCYTQMNVTEICFEVGYNSLGTFTRRFTELVGVSPTRLRVARRSCACSPAQMINRVSTSLKLTRVPAVIGSITTPPEFDGHILVGIFRRSLPQGSPVAWTLLSQGGIYQLSGVPEGTYHIFALAWSPASDLPATLESEPAWRAGGQQICISNEGIRGSTDLRLRLGTLFDPPILMAPSLLLTQMFAPA
jgi:AraC family transcriptional regulator